MTFADRAKLLKDKSPLTLAEIAEACSVSESMVSRYINGKIVPPVDIADKILEVLQASVPEAAEDAEERGEDMGLAIDQIKEIYTEQIKVIQREKYILSVVVVILFVVIVYLCIDALHGNWGFFQYPVV